MVKKKYSKSSSQFYLNTKSDFFLNNDDLLKKAKKQNKIYSTQPKRNKCKICNHLLPISIDFSSHKVNYIFCSNCNHLNGIYDDTKSFVKKIYMSEGGSEYSQNYLDENFSQRTNDIYLPKLDFLISSLPKKKIRILDVGCGSGYFVHASLLKRISARGIDVNETMINYGNKNIYHHLKQSPLKTVSENSLFKEIKNSNDDVISAIGVIEHLREPKKFFEAFKSSRVKYLYYSVPMFSLTVILEIIFKNVFPRQLSGAHTHLFTENSISKLNELIGVKPIAEWRFGTDVMDLYRNLLVSIKSKKVSGIMINYLNNSLGKKIDDIQSILDINHSCSEIHLIAEKI